MQDPTMDQARSGYSALIARALAGGERSPAQTTLSCGEFGDRGNPELNSRREQPAVNAYSDGFAAPFEKTAAPAGSEPNKRAPRILVVDDEPMIRKLNRDVLRQSGFHVDAVEDGAVAWDALQATRYDLVVTDHKMPRMTGIELLQKVHSSAMALPVIVASGTLTRDELNRHPGLQPAAVLLKPYTLDELVVTVKSVLGARLGS